MTDKDKQYIDDLKYFWQESGDMRRLNNFDMDRLEQLHPVMAHALRQYEFARHMLDSLSNN